MVFQHDLKGILHVSLDKQAAEAQAKWHDFGTGARLGKLKREDGTGLVLYHVREDADEGAFAPHTHTGGEMYLVLEGEVSDEDGTYPPGTMVWMKPGSRHTPITKGDTWILVLWPDGVEA